MVRAGLYLRISRDPDGTQTATSRQREDCARYAEQRGWTIVDEFEDVDLSAWQRTVTRPQFERLLDALKAGDLDVVLAWKFDRVLRTIRDFARLNETARDAGAHIVDMHGVDTSTTAGRFTASIMSAMAEAESENTSIRIRRKHEEIAASGTPIKGGHRLYGYERGREAIIPEEAAHIREAVRRVYAGESLHGICVDWGKRGIVTTKGNPWRHGTLRRLLMRAALSGQREYRGELTKGSWPAIVTPEDTERLRAILTRREHTPKATRYLLTGLLFCSHCDGPLWGHRDAQQRPRYVCPKQPGYEGCGRTARLAVPIEEYVEDLLFTRLDSTALQTYLGEQHGTDGERIMMEMEADEASLLELSDDYYTHRTIDRPEWLRQRANLNARLESNRRLLSQTHQHSLLASIAGAGEKVRAEWGDRPFAWKRTVISAAIEAITIHPGVRGRNRFDPSTIAIGWRF